MNLKSLLDRALGRDSTKTNIPKALKPLIGLEIITENPNDFEDWSFNVSEYGVENYPLGVCATRALIPLNRYSRIYAVTKPEDKDSGVEAQLLPGKYLCVQYSNKVKGVEGQTRVIGKITGIQRLKGE